MRVHHRIKKRNWLIAGKYWRNIQQYVKRNQREKSHNG
ncbi:hypothetical protein GPAL_0565 [Glaciecola pallidula DSM 14239 = ACAM 615]|uniref:Uncharacterized protein n=1 Tax=Brumicola pallidula DSM 14239 = ACAM 615 TaxID=1121922 RepID=K6ZVU4_9ALTE|nr:hypothetical protein GPAL_0565 [Glaciecola pallidula DSM 14239 = ACAM 615]